MFSIFGHAKNDLIRKLRYISKFNITNWIINNYNINIARYLER